jgi:hypothetical protein
MRKLFVAVAVGAALLGGCDSPSAAEKFDPVGSLSFSYQGVISGTFQATGEIDVQPGTVPAAATGATAYREDEQVSLMAFQARGGSRGDAFALLLGQAAPGTVTLNATQCQQQSMAECRVGIFVPDVDAAELPGTRDPSRLLQKSYVLVLGNVTIASRTRHRIKGTFQGVALRANDPNLQNAVNVTAGQFDLPIRPEEN